MCDYRLCMECGGSKLKQKLIYKHKKAKKNFELVLVELKHKQLEKWHQGLYTAMGRGRNNGPVDQSTKKPKVTKNKVRGDLQMFHPHIIEENTELPILVSEDLLAEMKKMCPQDLMNILLSNQCEQGY